MNKRLIILLLSNILILCSCIVYNSIITKWVCQGDLLLKWVKNWFSTVVCTDIDYFCIS